MAESVAVRINVDRTRTRLSQESGRIWSPEEVLQHFRDCGLIEQDDIWIAVSSSDLSDLEFADLDAIGPATCDNSGRWTAQLSPMSALDRQKAAKIAREVAQGFSPPPARARLSDAAKTVLFPRAFVGVPKEARSRGRSLIRKVVRRLDWSIAHDPAEMVPMSEISGDIVLSRPLMGAAPGGVYLHSVVDDLLDFTECDDRNLWYERQRDLVLSGLDPVWFCIAASAAGRWFIKCDTADSERMAIARTVMGKVLLHWPILCALDARITNSAYRGWPCWWSR